jgi:hypothetical protein
MVPAAAQSGQPRRRPKGHQSSRPTSVHPPLPCPPRPPRRCPARRTRTCTTVGSHHTLQCSPAFWLRHSSRPGSAGCPLVYPLKGASTQRPIYSRVPVIHEAARHRNRGSSGRNRLVPTSEPGSRPRICLSSIEIEAKLTSRPCNAPLAAGRGHANPSLTTQTVRILADSNGRSSGRRCWNGVVRDPLWEASYSGGPGCVGLVCENEGGLAPRVQQPASARFAALRLLVRPLFADCGDDSLPGGPSLIAESSHNGDRVIPTRIFRLQWC